MTAIFCTRPGVRHAAWSGIPLALVALLFMFGRWDWFIPLVQAQASAALGRTVTIDHLHVSLGRIIEIAVDHVVVANPPNWTAGDPPFAAAGKLTVQVKAWDYIIGHGLMLPLISIERPSVFATEKVDGTPNFQFLSGSVSSRQPPVIGDLRIADGDAHIVIPRLKADFSAKFVTQDQGETTRLTVEAKGTYAAQPIMARLVGGALLSLRDVDHPWPIELVISNGPTRVALKGTVQDPLTLKGANVTLQFSGPDAALLEPLVGFPIPQTPSYEVAGKLDFEGLQKIKFENFHGRLGSSDIAGSIQEEPNGTQAAGRAKLVVTMDLRSNRVDLVDLNGFIGGQPGRTITANATEQQRAKVAQADAMPRLFPDTPISVPRLNWADIHLRYHGSHIEGRDMPLDSLDVAMDVVDGKITIHPVSFAIGRGKLSADVSLTPESGKAVRTKVDIRMQNLDVSRLMAATHAFQGAGSVSGLGTLDATGDSFASLMANGNGGVKMAMAGGDLSALLVDLTGLQFGKALLSAIGIPQQTAVACFVSDLGLHHGILAINSMVLNTSEGITNIGGNIDLGSERIDLSLKTDSKHFSIGSLPARISITGTFKEPSIRPGLAVAARAGAMAGLAALLPPLAVLPTIQLGTSEQEDARCGTLLQQARASAGGRALPAPPNLQMKERTAPAR